MATAGSTSAKPSLPLWLLAELTYKCPLQCPYCSNPVDFAGTYRKELETDDWIRVMREARKMGSLQIGFSGGEPLVRKDLELLIAEAKTLGYYSNLITSGVGMDEKRVKAFREAGLDHIQISFQASSEEVNDFIAGTRSFEHKLEMARQVKAQGYPMVLNIVLHRHNIEQLDEILSMCAVLKADYVELANTQYYGWSFLNRDQLMPTREQVKVAEGIANEHKARNEGKMKILFVVPDYFEERPKACMNGWGSTFLTIAPDGSALPCHAAAQLPGLSFPNVREHSIGEIWNDSEAFNKFRGFDWMSEPCRSCSEKEKDFGGCRCQAFMLTGDATAADPVCSKSPHHEKILQAVDQAAATLGKDEHPLVFRNLKNSRALSENG